MKARKLSTFILTLSISLTPSLVLAQMSNAGSQGVTPTNPKSPNTITSPNTTNRNNSSDVNTNKQGDINPSVSERTIPDINNPQANDNLSTPRTNTDGAIVDRNGNEINSQAQSNYNSQTWRQVQEKLNQNNFPVGTADGVNGRRTTEALRNYQRSQNLEVTGRLNQETLDAMEIDYSRSNQTTEEYSE